MIAAGLRELEASRGASDDYSLVRDIYIAMATACRLGMPS
jgi:hypothetical protein